ncbi:MAG: sel1 repeat family protein [Pseudomonadota bacterium]|nr:sel1 repeat family protein [Pseudomonadota bacterium]
MIVGIPILLVAVAVLVWQVESGDEDELLDVAEKLEAARARDGIAEYAEGMRLLARPTTDPQGAVRHLERSAHEGYAPAQYQLSVALRDGVGVVADQDRALIWLRLAAEAGEPRAQLELGQMYLEGRGVARNVVTGYAWLNVAAARGAPGAHEARNAARLAMSPAEADASEAEAKRFMELRLPNH